MRDQGSHYTRGGSPRKLLYRSCHCL